MQFNPGGPVSNLSDSQLEASLTVEQRNALSRIHPIQTGQATGDRGRLVDFFTLKEPNPFGNTKRFTDENGAQVYASNYVIDWATGIGWCRTSQPSTSYAGQATAAAAFTLTTSIGVLSGWRVPNQNEMNDIVNKGMSMGLNYAPFNISSSLMFWLSTISATSPTVQAWAYSTGTSGVYSSTVGQGITHNAIFNRLN